MSRGLALVCLISLFGSPLVAARHSADALAATMAEDGVTPVLEPIDGDPGDVAAAPTDGPSARFFLARPAGAGLGFRLPRPSPLAICRVSTSAPRPAPIRVRLARLQTFLI